MEMSTVQPWATQWQHRFASGLFRLAAVLLAISACLVLVASTISNTATMAVLVAVASVAVGFFPLRFVARMGTHGIPAVWIGTMTLRMFVALMGIAMLIGQRGMDPGTVVAFSIGSYLLLLGLETAGMLRLITRADAI